ncbi:hypothetical protein [uncultured Brevundimonas sp.]|uniref:hypothetical protein n=1 Tax=uncultured Brevundimonas sp. TaxID=213418 RepID=UPI0030EDB96B
MKPIPSSYHNEWHPVDAPDDWFSDGKEYRFGPAIRDLAEVEFVKQSDGVLTVHLKVPRADRVTFDMPINPKGRQALSIMLSWDEETASCSVNGERERRPFSNASATSS